MVTQLYRILPKLFLNDACNAGFAKAFFINSFRFLILLNACQKTAIQYGQQYLGNGLTNIILVDSMQPAVSTVLKDSVITSQTQTALIGNYNDPYFGKINANAFFQLVPSSNTIPDLLQNAQYDSLVVLMKCDGSFYGDTTLKATYTANQVSSEITLIDQVSFYNTSSFPVNSTALGTGAGFIRPAFGDTVHIPLSNSLGSLFFGMIKRKSDTLKNQQLFLNYFKGLQVTSQNGAAVYGFKDSLVMRLFYHQTDLNLTNKFYDFTLNSRNLQFNHISADRSGTPLAALGSSSHELASTKTGNIGFSQAVTGIYTKVSFPNIRDLLQRPDFVELVKAELIIKPVNNTYDNFGFKLPPQLVAAVTDALNEPGGPLISGSGTTASIQTGNFFQDPLTISNTNYSYDVTNYLLQQLAATTNINQNGLLLVPPSGSRSNTFNRLAMGDARYSNVLNRIQLKIYYISVIH